MPAVRLSSTAVFATAGIKAAATAMAGQDRTMVVVARNIQTTTQANSCLASSGGQNPYFLQASPAETGLWPHAFVRRRGDAHGRTRAEAVGAGRWRLGLRHRPGRHHGTAIADSNGGSNVGGGGQVYIGGWQNAGTQCGGKADVLTVIVWNRALAAAELKQAHRRYCELLG